MIARDHRQKKKTQKETFYHLFFCFFLFFSFLGQLWHFIDCSAASKCATVWESEELDTFVEIVFDMMVSSDFKGSNNFFVLFFFISFFF